jgi:lysophospholipase L1-like esterase
MKRFLAILAILTMIIGGTAMGEFAKEEWYQSALKDSEMRLGNNVRLIKLIERARAGEHITIGTMGGSITEGAGASNYKECWASRFAMRFGNTYGVSNGSNVELVNAGVGGTPSAFGYMRFNRDINSRVSEKDPDGYPDLVIIEFAVNDWGEPTNHHCFESMVKEVLEYPNEPAVILLFSMRDDGWNLQGDLRKIGDVYDLLMVSIPDGLFKHVGQEMEKKDFFHDEYHPNSNGHRMMADCLMQAIADAAAKEPNTTDIDLNVRPAYGTDFMGLKTLYADEETEGFTVERGGFASIDLQTYRNTPVGWVCGKNYFHDIKDPDEPLKVTGVFSKCLIAWKASADAGFGAAEVYVDGKLSVTLRGGPGKWNQSEVALVLNGKNAAEHTVLIKVKEPGKKFTITAIAVK